MRKVISWRSRACGFYCHKNSCHSGGTQDADSLSEAVQSMILSMKISRIVSVDIKAIYTVMASFLTAAEQTMQNAYHMMDWPDGARKKSLRVKSSRSCHFSLLTTCIKSEALTDSRAVLTRLFKGCLLSVRLSHKVNYRQRSICFRGRHHRLLSSYCCMAFSSPKFPAEASAIPPTSYTGELNQPCDQNTERPTASFVV